MAIGNSDPLLVYRPDLSAADKRSRPVFSSDTDSWVPPVTGLADTGCVKKTDMVYMKFYNLRCQDRAAYLLSRCYL
jgi:hypothetical protein